MMMTMKTWSMGVTENAGQEPEAVNSNQMSLGQFD